MGKSLPSSSTNANDQHHSRREAAGLVLCPSPRKTAKTASGKALNSDNNCCWGPAQTRTRCGGAPGQALEPQHVMERRVRTAPRPSLHSGAATSDFCS
ncbi:unnamed protein product [Arctogadus glacialis]